MQQVYRVAKQVAPSRATVLVTGESGTGKGEFARAIHALSPRAKKPFVAVHCAALAESLLESELFVHEKGSFTGAERRRIGKFEQAHEGTIFLDEIGEIPAATQVKLLTVLQDRRFERVGGKTSAFTERAKTKLRSYRWPGNVRELENAIERAVVMCESAEIDDDHLPYGAVAREVLGGIAVPGATMAEVERFAILTTLDAVDGSTTQAAEILDISVRTIQYRLQEYGLVKERGRSGK